MFKLKQINKEIVEPVKFIDVKEDKRPIRGADIFPEIYCNIFFCARKKSGKTCAIAKIIDKCSTSETRVIAFVSTLYKDNTWRAIQDMCKKKDIDFTGYTSIKDEDTKEDIVDSIMKALGEPGDKKEETEKTPYVNPVRMGIMDSRSEEKKKKKPKELAPEIIFIFDDLSGELLSPSIAKLLKRHRHYKCKTIVSSQYWNDIVVQGRKQLDYVLLYQGFAQSLSKLSDIHKNLDLGLPFERFVQLYRFATNEKYHFLYINVVDGVYRKDFTHEIELPREEEDDEERDL